MAQEANIIEIESKASMIHIKDKQQAGDRLRDSILANGGTQKDVDNAAAYSIQLEVSKDPNDPTFKTLVDAVKHAGVHANRESMKLVDGDTVTRRDGTPVAPHMFLIDARSKYDVDVVDTTGQPIHLDEEPGDGTMVIAAINVKANRDKSKAIYFLSAVMIEKLEKRPDTHYVFSRFRKTEQTGFDDGGVDAF
jgi:hypothetical protein